MIGEGAEFVGAAGAAEVGGLPPAGGLAGPAAPAGAGGVAGAAAPAGVGAAAPAGAASLAPPTPDEATEAREKAGPDIKWLFERNKIPVNGTPYTHQNYAQVKPL